MFGLGLPEILFICLVAAVVLGPEHMPRAANLLGKWSAKLRSAATSFGEAVSNDEDLREIRSTMHDVKAEIESVKSELTGAKHEMLDVSRSTKAAFDEARAELKTLGRTEKGGESDVLEKEMPMASENKTEDRDHLIKDEDASENEISGMQRVRLARPFLLPGEISRKVSRFRIPLKAAMPTQNDSIRGVVLPQVRPNAPMLCVRCLERAGQATPGALKCIKLQSPVSTADHGRVNVG